VTNAAGCTSSASANVAINTQPATPSAPAIGTITQPTCATATGSVVINGLPATGTWTLTRTPDGVISSGTGISTTIAGIYAGIYSYTVTNASGCTSVSSANVVINAQPATPSAPAIGTITQPTCATAIGSVVINGLPATGTWTLTRTPDGVISSGTGISTTIAGLATGTYTYTVTNAAGCTSKVSENVVINAQPGTPSAPTIGTITQPTCATATGSVVINGLPATGIWTLTRTPDGVISSGTGISTTIAGLATGTYTYTVTNAAGCTSKVSANVVINAQPATPSAPTIGTITQPTCAVATGSVVLNGLPAAGTWTLTRTPGGVITSGTEISTTIAGLAEGTYNYAVTNASGCTSAASANVVINAQPVTPSVPIVGNVTQPTCVLETGSVDLSGLPASGNWTLTRNPDGLTTTGKGTSATVSSLTHGTYSYTVTNAGGCTSGVSANVVVTEQPGAPTTPVISGIVQPTCSVTTGTITITPQNGTGITYFVDSSINSYSNNTGIFTLLPPGIYTVTIKNSTGCVSGSTSVTVNPVPANCGTIVLPGEESCTVFVPNSFSPNADGINDNFKITCLNYYANPIIEIYNRWGNLIFKKEHYGDVDYWGNETDAWWDGRSDNKLTIGSQDLPIGTYFYVLKLRTSKVMTGFLFLNK